MTHTEVPPNLSWGPGVKGIVIGDVRGTKTAEWEALALLPSKQFPLVLSLALS